MKFKSIPYSAAMLLVFAATISTFEVQAQSSLPDTVKAVCEGKRTLVDIIIKPGSPKIVVVKDYELKDFEKTGYFEVDCEKTARFPLYYPIPTDCEVASHAALLVNTDHIKNPIPISTIEGNQVAATGQIDGVDKIAFNCPGGGHATLVLRGQFRCKIEKTYTCP